MNSPEADAVYLENIVKGLVSNPEEVTITRTLDERGVLLSVSCAATDMGKLIGREGTNAKAIRTILNAYGMNNQAKIGIKILEPIGSTRGDNA